MTEVKKKRPGRWKAGASGNPAGRPPSAVAFVVRHLLDVMRELNLGVPT